MQASKGDRKQFYAEISARNLTPLWEVLSNLVTPAPVTTLQPALWSYAAIRDDVLRAGTVISADEAERRVLIMENPALRRASSITNTLYAGLQLVLPGEVARSHRHTQSALRLVLDGDGAYTTVDGERRTMKRGDFIITPRWTWHDHGNLGNEPVIWLDGLDIPLVRALEASFAEPGAERSQSRTRPDDDNLARFGHNMVPIDHAPTPSDAPRLFVYPYSQTLQALEGIRKGPVDSCVGYKLRYVNPATGRSPMPTIGAFAQFVPQGMETTPYRSTDGSVYVCLDGSGTVRIGEHEFRFALNDVFVVPSWMPLKILAGADVVLFSFSDRPVQEMLGLWREHRGESPRAR